MNASTLSTFALLALAAAFPGHTAAAEVGCPGSLDPAFDAGAGVLNPHGTVPNSVPTARLLGTNVMPGADLRGPNTFNSITVQPDGKIILAGGFYAVQNVARTGLARLEADGSLDFGFAPTLTAETTLRVRAVILRPDGKILIGGNFHTVNGQNRPGLAQLNADGSLDHDLSMEGSDFVETHALAVMADGRIAVSESHVIFYDDLPPETVHGLVRLLPSGAWDRSFAPALPLQKAVMSLLADPDGRLLLDGLVRLQVDGTYDSTYAPELPTDFQVQSVLLLAGGKVLIAGGAYPPPPERSALSLTDAVIRLHADGSRDTEFVAPTIGFLPEDSADASLGSRAMVQQADGKIVLGGLFKMVNGIPRTDVARLNADGTLDPSFEMDILVHPGFDHEEVETVTAMALSPEGKLLLGGFFRTVNGQPVSNLVRCYSGFDPRPYRIGPDSLFHTTQGRFHLRLHVPFNSQFSVQASTDLLDWMILTNFTIDAVTGPIDFEDVEAPSFNRRFYRIGGPGCEP